MYSSLRPRLASTAHLHPTTPQIIPPIHNALPTASIHPTTPTLIQTRHATLIPRPHRPYTFTQLITLSDGSTFLHRTTSPQPVHRSTKDTKNSALWNPSSQKLLNIEEDEAGKLRAFRRRFGRGFDVDSGEEGGESVETPEEGDAGPTSSEARRQLEREDESLMDLISGFGKEKEAMSGDEAPGGAVREEKKRSGKGKGGEK